MATGARNIRLSILRTWPSVGSVNGEMNHTLGLRSLWCPIASTMIHYCPLRHRASRTPEHIFRANHGTTGKDSYPACEPQGIICSRIPFKELRCVMRYFRIRVGSPHA
jgi:hypothetical protein